ncbi:MAG: S-layer homology domain-containing protein [Clostridia bacterium]|nr:S-layer homology domain-containing protein [Clostridia bacterium]
MKGWMKRGCAALLLCLCMSLTFCLQSSAENAAAPLTPALQVLAGQREMSVATLSGNDYYFSEDVFARTLNLAHVGSITVTSLPSVTAGELLMGSERVSAGQRISAKDLSLLCFVAADDEVIGAAFDFSPEMGGYQMTCNIHILEQVNYSPTVQMAESAALQVSTHRALVGYGQLSAYDPEGDTLTFEVVRAPEHGLVVMTDATLGEYVYLPRGNFVGEDSFCYVARDACGNYSTMAEVAVTVKEPATQIVYADMIGRREYNDALSMTEAGIMQGVQSNAVWNFNPDAPICRADFVVMAMQVKGIESLPQTLETGFSDQEQMSETQRVYVAAAKALGYVEGREEKDGKRCFAPTDSITRAEAAVILHRMLDETQNMPVSAPAFADGDDIPAWAGEAVTTLAAHGILRPIGGAISPESIVSRADAATMLHALMRYEAQK